MQAIPSDENNPLRMEKKISFDITTKHLKHLLSIAILCSLVLFINCGEDSENPQGGDYPAIYAPVCDAEDNAYGNSCQAEAAGIGNYWS